MRHRILILDDEAAILFSLRQYFQAHGCAVDCAKDLGTAEALLAHNRYDGVITDLRLSGSQSAEGLSLLHKLRADGRNTPVIMLTGYGSPEIQREASRLGVAAFLVKPKPLAEVGQILFGLMEQAS